MADRYWISGSGTWNNTNTAVWSATPTGGGGASVPTSADDVYFQNPGTYTVTVGAIVTCGSLSFTGFTGTFAGSFSININGSFTAVSTMTWSSTSLLLFASTSGSHTITPAGKTFSSLSFGFSGGSTGTYALAGALTATSTITVYAGTFTTNNYAVTAASLASSNSNTRTINLGASTVTLTGITHQRIDYRGKHLLQSVDGRTYKHWYCGDCNRRQPNCYRYAIYSKRHWASLSHVLKRISHQYDQDAYVRQCCSC